MTISSGSYTFGTGGADYATMYDALNDLAFPLTGDLTLTCIGSHTNSTAIDLSAIDLGGYTLEITSDSSHAGVVGDGHIITYTASGATSMTVEEGTLAINDLQIAWGSGANAYNLLIAAGANGVLDIHDIIIDSAGSGYTNAFSLTFSNTDISSTADIYNILYANGNHGITSSGCISLSGGYNDMSGWSMYNCTVDGYRGHAFYFDSIPLDAQAPTLDNLIGYNSYSGGGFGVFDYSGINADEIPAQCMSGCASNDDTADGGTNAVINYTAADEFVSLSSASADFMVPKGASQMRFGGAAVSSTTDIKGNVFNTYTGAPRGAYNGAALTEGAVTFGDTDTGYADLSEALTDLAAALTGNLTLTCNASHTQSTAVPGKTLDLAGYDLVIDSDSPHSGVVGAGHVISTGVSSNQFFIEDNSGDGSFELKNLQYLVTTGISYILRFTLWETVNDPSYSIHDIIADVDNKAGVNLIYCRSIARGHVEVYNVLLFNSENTNATNGCLHLFLNGNSPASCFMNNCTVVNDGSGRSIGLQSITVSGMKFYNLIGINDGSGAFYYNGSEAINNSEKHASADSSASGAGAITNFTPADEFESLDDANALFMVPKASSQFDQAGAAVSTTLDLFGNAYTDGNPPIGAYNASTPIPAGGSGGYGRGIGLGIGLGGRSAY